MISCASGAPSTGGAGSGARCISVDDDEGELCLCCKLGGAGTAEEVVVTFGLRCRLGELASEGDVAVGRARSGERWSRESRKGGDDEEEEVVAPPLVRRRAAAP